MEARVVELEGLLQQAQTASEASAAEAEAAREALASERKVALSLLKDMKQRVRTAMECARKVHPHLLGPAQVTTAELVSATLVP